MITRSLGISAVAVLLGLSYVSPGLVSRTPKAAPSQSVAQVDQRAFEEFEHRVGAYAELHREVARTVPPWFFEVISRTGARVDDGVIHLQRSGS
jgi:hypothetical protein